MAHTQQKLSEKLHLVDQETFFSMQEQSSSATRTKIIRNSKYKKTHNARGCNLHGATVNLWQFLTSCQRPIGFKLKLRQRRVKDTLLKRGGHRRRNKMKEGGRKKKSSRMKSAILRYRQRKQLQSRPLDALTWQLRCCQLDEVTRSFDALTLPTVPLPATLTAAQDTMTVSTKTTTTSDNNSILHSRRFRSYCDNNTTSTLGQLTDQLLRDLYRFQKRAYAKNQIKAAAHRRFVLGFREVQNFMHIQKVKLVIIAPDCEESPGEAGLDEIIAALKQQCKTQNVPYAFALQRRQLAYTLFKKVPVSCVAVLNYDGAQDIYAELLQELQRARQLYAKASMQTETQLATPKF